MKTVEILPKWKFEQTPPNPEAIAIRIIDPEGEYHADIKGTKTKFGLSFGI